MWRGRTPLIKLSPPMGPIVPLHPFSDGKCHVIQSNRLSFDAALPASLRIYRSVWSSSLLCWTELHVVSQRISWIHRESVARPVFNRECGSPTAKY